MGAGRVEIGLSIFFTCFSNILISKNLLAKGRVERRQNLEPQGLAGKILQNKKLAAYLGPGVAPVVGNVLKEPSRIKPDCAFQNSQ